MEVARRCCVGTRAGDGLLSQDPCALVEVGGHMAEGLGPKRAISTPLRGLESGSHASGS